MAPKSTKTQLVVWNPKRRKAIYKIRHYRTKKDIYVGQTVNEANRKAAYRAAVKKELENNPKAHNLAVAYVHECQDLGIQIDLEPLPEFPDGVPADRADGFEALMIQDLQTASACNPDGLNTSCGNCLGLHKPRFEEYREELKASGGVYVWSAADIAMRDAVPKEVVEAQGKAAALQHLEAMAEEETPEKPIPVLKKQVEGALVAVDDAMRKFMGPLQLAEALAETYEAQMDVLSVNTEAFKVDLNALRDKLKEEPVLYEDILGLCRAAELMAKREVTAGFVAHQFHALAQAIQAIEEAKLPDCKGVDIAKEIRKVLATTKLDWLRSVGNQDTLPEEAKVYDRLTDWKRRFFKEKGDDVTAHVAAMRFILRSNPETLQQFDAYVLHDREAKSDATSAQINAMLLEGYAHPCEPDFEGRKKWPSGTQGSETKRLYSAMRNFVDHITKGRVVTKERIELILNGLSDKWPERDVWWRNPTGLPCQRRKVVI